MKNKAVYLVLVVAFVLLGLIAWITAVFRLPPAVPAGGEATVARTSSPGEPMNAEARTVVERKASQTPAAPPASTPDPDSIDGILADLASPDKETRIAAIDRSKQLEDRSVVPRLQEAVERLEDVREKADLLAAIDFIKLPSLTEFQAARRSNLVSRGLSAPTQAITNR